MNVNTSSGTAPASTSSTLAWMRSHPGSGELSDYDVGVAFGVYLLVVAFAFFLLLVWHVYAAWWYRKRIRSLEEEHGRVMEELKREYGEESEEARIRNRELTCRREPEGAEEIQLAGMD
ncbi:hypothetical protein EK21DRAFT_87051 [Setomelanomma holmii]|uniref:Uncharacterized protein n=1 Tax=Setomelanomma holmii TaxID=210430 RepID=A0A9P4LNW7_9PLEO|nr:hypothetical protein EK21DRAFT_87051 [Setomelanomma holmii]